MLRTRIILQSDARRAAGRSRTLRARVRAAARRPLGHPRSGLRDRRRAGRLRGHARGGRRVGRPHRRRADATVGARHDRQPLLRRESRHRHLCAPPRRLRRARSRRSDLPLLARILAGRQGTDAGPLLVDASGRASGRRAPAAAGRRAALGDHDGRARRPGAVVAARRGSRLPREHAGIPARRSGSAHHRQDARVLSAGRDRRSRGHRVLRRLASRARRALRRHGAAAAEPRGRRAAAAALRRSASLSGLALMRVHAYRNPPEISGTGIINTRRWRAAEVPSTNGHGNARGVARLYSALAGDGELDGVHILSREIIAMAIAEQVYAEDMVLQRPTRFGLGFQLTMAERRLGPSPRAFGHFGAGGPLGSADPDARLAFGYAINQGRAGWQHKHVRHLIDLVYKHGGPRDGPPYPPAFGAPRRSRDAPLRPVDTGGQRSERPGGAVTLLYVPLTRGASVRSAPAEP